ncbi:MAG: response regulator [Cyanobacteria bacterium]|nr:response regulator [Cyanobacteriota bacterium]
MTAVILVVEDNEIERFVMEQLCQRLGYSVHVVCSGEDAIRALKVRAYAAVLLDLGLPGMSGFDCVQQIRRNERFSQSRVPVIAVTARTNEEAFTKCIDAGMDDFVGKPVDIETFREKLSRWLLAKEPFNSVSEKPKNQ